MNPNQENSAFPVTDIGYNDGLACTSYGLSKREFIATMLLQGIMANSTLNQGYSSPDDYTKRAIEQTDSLIKLLKE